MPGGGVDPALAAHLRAHFAYEGLVPNAEFQDNMRRIFRLAGPDVRIFVLLANVHFINTRGRAGVSARIDSHNKLITEVAAEFRQTELLTPSDFMSAEELKNLTRSQHYERMVYYRMFQHIMSRVAL